MQGLQQRDLQVVVQQLVADGVPLLGICVGMQILFEYSEEHGMHAGLGILPGKVLRFSESRTMAQGLKIPHTGWNQLHQRRGNALLDGLPAGSYAYFNHSYYCAPAEAADTLATTPYGQEYASVVGRGRIFGVQFHPEKSQQVGLAILKNFVQNG